MAALSSSTWRLPHHPPPNQPREAPHSSRLAEVEAEVETEAEEATAQGLETVPTELPLHMAQVLSHT